VRAIIDTYDILKLASGDFSGSKFGTFNAFMYLEESKLIKKPVRAEGIFLFGREKL